MLGGCAVLETLATAILVDTRLQRSTRTNNDGHRVGCLGSLVARWRIKWGKAAKCGLVGKSANKMEGQRARYLNRAQEAETDLRSCDLQGWWRRAPRRCAAAMTQAAGAPTRCCGAAKRVCDVEIAASVHLRSPRSYNNNTQAGAPWTTARSKHRRPMSER